MSQRLLLNEVLQSLDPEDIERQRQQFDDTPPPPYSSPETTAPPSPQLDASYDPDSFFLELAQTKPARQFIRERREEDKAIKLAVQHNHLTGLLEPYCDLTEAIVRERWIERGIWNWGPSATPGDAWKHTLLDAGVYHIEPVKPPRRYYPNIFGRQPRKEDTPPPPPAIPPNVDESRPYKQFEYEIALEQKRLETGRAPDGLPDLVYKRVKDKWVEKGLWKPQFSQHPEYELPKLTHAIWVLQNERFPDSTSDAKEMAYNNVKRRWISQKCWDSRWTDLPGKIWKHEQPEEKAFLRSLGRFPGPVYLEPSIREQQGLPPLRPPPDFSPPIESTSNGALRANTAVQPLVNGANVEQFDLNNQQPSSRERSPSKKRESAIIRKPRNKSKGQQRADSSPNPEAQEQPLTKTPNRNARGQRHSLPAAVQPPDTSNAPRRSARIAKKLREAEELQRQGSVQAPASTRTRKRKIAASSPHDVDNQSRLKRRNAPATANNNRSKAEMAGAKPRGRPRGRGRPKAKG
ncbi:hypothetical protein AJ80_01396 [Polytolypa hystricis UAMH7299]|uniref:Uncharacterized protein n=1 Tax=Polytolypa hystricis (strain UAMH7299) TaxID=1447883 RepID=A0A2B7Z0Q3_POLH7|nr:hypothetical protein AJ80_01396 [Polytolypa hystricis UAMH7299]